MLHSSGLRQVHFDLVRSRLAVREVAYSQKFTRGEISVGGSPSDFPSIREGETYGIHRGR
jgi:hypothetical protein